MSALPVEIPVLARPRVEAVADGSGFDALQDEWRDLLADSASNSLFLTWEWLRTWWRHRAGARPLRILAVRSADRLIAIAPLFRKPGRILDSLEFLGSDEAGSDYLDVIVRAGWERQTRGLLAEHLARENAALRLAQVHSSGSSTAEVARTLLEREWHGAASTVSICPFIDLRGHSFDSYLATLDSDHRYNFRRRLRNLAKRHSFRFEVVSREGERHEALSALIALHRSRWAQRGGTSAFHDSSLVRFHEEMTGIALRRGWLRLFVLRLDGRPVAALYGFHYNGTFSFYQSGFDLEYAKDSVGLVTMGLAIQGAIEEGAGEYDLLRGAEAYKSLWSRSSRELSRWELAPPGVSGWLHWRTRALEREVKRMARRVLPQTLVERLTRARVTGLRLRHAPRAD